MASRQANQENEARAGLSRFGPRVANKNALSVVNGSHDNIKKAQPQKAAVKKPTPFAIYDENVVDSVQAKKQSGVWAPVALVGAKPQRQVLQVLKETKPEHALLKDVKSGLRQVPPTIFPADFEDSTYSSTSSIDTSLHQSDFVLQARDNVLGTEIQDLSPMVVDTSVTEDSKQPAAAEVFSQHLESNLPEVYMADIYAYLRDCEARHRPKPYYMKKQTDITTGMRCILIDWLVEVAEEYKLHNETLYLAVSFIDRFLSHMSVLRGKLQLVGTAAMFVAAKYEEIYPPEVGEFVYITDDTYTKKQVLRMEQLVLKVLAFELAVPTSHYFLQRFSQMTRSSEVALHLATYLCELTLLETEPYLHFMPSEVAAACVALARLSSGHDMWPASVSEATGYSSESLISCMKHLHSSWSQAPASAQQAIREKYKSEKWHAVSLMTPPPLSVLELAQF